MIVPRPYQSAAVENVFARVAAGEKSTLIVMATGLGKTVCFGLAARRWARDRHPGRVLVLAHREELISQAVAELRGILEVEPEVEMAERWASVAGSSFLDHSPVVVASVQSLCQPRRLERFPRDEFGLIVTDEAHHATADSYLRIFGRFPDAFRLGVTATPKRADQVALGSIFGSLSSEMGICEAVSEGYLVPVEQRYVTVRDMDLSSVHTSGGDLDQGELGAVLTGDRVLDQMVAATVELCGSEPTLIFTAPRPPGDTVSQGDLFADALNKLRPGKAVFLSGETDKEERRRELELFESGHRQYLVGCSLFTEGFNVPKISRVVMARPTKSIVYYTQAIGRGTRTLKGVLTPDLDNPESRRQAIAASAKPSVLVIDFVGNSGRHKLVSAVDIFAGKHSAEAVTRAKKKAAQSGQPKAIPELLDEAEKALERERLKKEAEKRRRAEKALVRVNRVDLHQEEVSPFDTSDGPGQRRKLATGGRATVTQREWIDSHGGHCPEDATASEAGAIIADIKARWKDGLCSPKQERVLKRCGLADGPIPKAHAKALLDWLAKIGWTARSRPDRSRLKIVAVANGLDTGYQLQIDSHAVGGVFGSPDQVREAYRGLVAEPAPQVA